MASRDKQPDAAQGQKSSGKSSASLSEADWKEIASDANRLRSVPENADFRYQSSDGNGDGAPGAEQGRTGDAETEIDEDRAASATRSGTNRRD